MSKNHHCTYIHYTTPKRMLSELVIIKIRLSPNFVLKTDPASDPTVMPINDEVLNSEII